MKNHRPANTETAATSPRCRARSNSLTAPLGAAKVPSQTHVQGLLRALERHDPGSGEHGRRVGRLSVWLAAKLGLSASHTGELELAAALHDIGKLNIPLRCLRKPGPLLDGEWRIMRSHALAGERLLDPARHPTLALAARVAREHHERFDGSGYPFGLQGRQIALAARIVAVADVFDALLSQRCYKPAWPLQQVTRYFQQQSGKQFDPAVSEALLSAPESAMMAAEAKKNSANAQLFTLGCLSTVATFGRGQHASTARERHVS